MLPLLRCSAEGTGNVSIQNKQLIGAHLSQYGGYKKGIPPHELSVHSPRVVVGRESEEQEGRGQRRGQQLTMMAFNTLLFPDSKKSGLATVVPLVCAK